MAVLFWVAEGSPSEARPSEARSQPIWIRGGYIPYVYVYIYI